MIDPKELVRTSYDRVAERHAEWASRTRTAERERYANLLLKRLPANAAVLDLGCGIGIPTTRTLAGKFCVRGVDLSERHIALARQNVPAARFSCRDMTQLIWPSDSVDAIAAFYSIIHVPRDEHRGLFERISGWLRPGGLFVGTLGTTDDPAGHEEDWLGAPMFWSSFDVATSVQLISAAGLEIEAATVETADEDGQEVPFLWVVARRPSRSSDMSGCRPPAAAPGHVIEPRHHPAK